MRNGRVGGVVTGEGRHGLTGSKGGIRGLIGVRGVFFLNLFVLRIIPHIQGNCAPPLITHRREVAYMKAKRTWLLEIKCSGH